ncbi:MAG: radical SAM protein [Candidatus Acidiferrales bacterium]
MQDGPLRRGGQPLPASRRRRLSARERGGGTIFFSWCNLRCVFCQNYELSWEGAGQGTPPAELVAMMLRLQALGCHNINFVTPEHVVL